MKRIKITVLLIYCAYWRGVPQKTHRFGPIAPKASRNFWISRWKSCRSRLPIITTITSWDATKRRMKKSSPKSCRHYGKRPLYPKLSAALQTAGSWSLRQRMGIPASSGLMKPVPWRRRNILCAFRRRGDLGSGAENSGNISGIQGSDGVKRQIEKAGCSLLVCS